jgi:hypothetical protein
MSEGWGGGGLGKAVPSKRYAPDLTKDCCVRCRFWVRKMPDGECRAKPPVVTQSSSFPTTSWPRTAPGDWCGKYAASGMEARQGGNEVPSRSDDSPTAEGGDAHKPSPTKGFPHG